MQVKSIGLKRKSNLSKRVLIEVHELELAVMEGGHESIYDGCKDVINIAMMVVDKLD